MKKIMVVLFSCVLITVLFSINVKLNNNEITIYTSQEKEDIDFLIKNFKQKYPDINLNIVKAATGEITAKLLLEKNNPQADFIWNLDVASMLILEKENILKSYKPYGIDKIDPKFYDSKNNIPKWIGTTIETVVLLVNKAEAVKKNLPIPKTFGDLTKEIYKDEIVMPDPLSSGTGYLAISSWLQSYSEKDGWEFIEKLNDNIKFYTTSGSSPAKSVGMGETVVGITFDKASIRIANDTKEVVTVFPGEGLPWTVNTCAIVNKENVKQETMIFYEWAISEEAMNLYNEIRVLTSFVESVPSSEVPQNFREYIGINDVYWSAENKSKICAKFKEKFNK